MPTDQSAINTGRLRSLDTCRGLAILMVVGFHASIPYAVPHAAQRIVEFGNQGVQLFFLVSAVTMCHVWEQRSVESHRVLKFYIRRFFRIAPLFWFAIILYTWLWHYDRFSLTLLSITPRDILLTAVFLHPLSVTAINSVVPGGWSIGIEMGFYVIFPTLAKFLHSRRVLLLLCAFATYIVLGIIGTTIAERFGTGPKYSTFLYYSFLTQLPIFPLGMLIYSLTRGGKSVALITLKSLTPLLLGWLLLAFIAKWQLHLTARPFFWLQNILLGVLVGCCIRWNIQSRLLAFLGRLSYSMYLFHFAVLYGLEYWFGKAWPYPFGLAVALACTVPIAMLSQFTAEKWSQEAARKLIQRFFANSSSSERTFVQIPEGQHRRSGV